MKKALIALAVVIVLGGAAMAFLATRPRVSPLDTVTSGQAGVDVKVAYSRPYKKGRLIFGEKSAQALVPYGEYWRLGANEATEITFSKAVTFGGKPVAAGRYRIYGVPGASSWKIVLNSALGKWGAGDADHDKDVLTVEVAPAMNPTSLEQFTISFVPDPSAIEFAWDTTAVRVPYTAALAGTPAPTNQAPKAPAAN